MKIDQLRIRNFKIFRKADIDFRPLTILTGANSSGKSTVLTAITSILQSPTNLFPFKYTPNGKMCQLGGYKDIVFGHNTREHFSLGLSVSHGEAVGNLDASFRNSSSGNQILPKTIDFHDDTGAFTVAWQAEGNGYWASIDNPIFDSIRSKDTPGEIKACFSSVNVIVNHQSDPGAR